MSQHYCTSCGFPIPDGQGKSCSMCYGDIAHGTDGYYQQWADEQMRQEQEREEDSRRQSEAEHGREMNDANGQP